MQKTTFLKTLAWYIMLDKLETYKNATYYYLNLIIPYENTMTSLQTIS